eukprot:TRINITY_DN2291_c1_g1_i3.p1 TRINITY_DN2291_c1_g1~~TRINITY_DN2291_c1_g1_i3.p1  ORF type:complete len:343 (-),score=27.82 TRINITY_DN2291_c1_g1_i3:239-1267(-)
MSSRKDKRKLVDMPVVFPPIVTGTGNPLIDAARRKGGADPDAIKAVEKAAEAKLIAETEAVHREGWNSGMKKGEKYGTALGLSMGFNNIIKGDDYMLLDKKHPDRVVTGATYKELMAKKSVKENPRYDWLQPGFTYNADGTAKTDMDTYAGAAITHGDDRTVLHITRFRDRVRAGDHVPYRYPALDDNRVPRLRKSEMTIDEAFDRIPKPPERPVYRTPAEKRIAKEAARGGVVPVPMIAAPQQPTDADLIDILGRDFMADLLNIPEQKPVKEPTRTQPPRQAKGDVFDLADDKDMALRQQAVSTTPTKKGGRRVLPAPPKIVQRGGRPLPQTPAKNPGDKK